MILQKKEYNLNRKELKRLEKKFQISEPIMELLFLRGIDTEEKINDFLHPNISKLKNPYIIKNIKEV